MKPPVAAALTALTLAALLLAACGPAKAPSSPSTQLVMSLDQLPPPQSVTTVKLAEQDLSSPHTQIIHVVRLREREVLVLSAKDPNQGCTVPWNGDEGVFHNPCHGATYDIRGQVLTGPAIRGLDRFAVRVDEKAKTLTADLSVAPQPGPPLGAR